MENQVKELSLGFCQGIVVFFNQEPLSFYLDSR